MSNEVQSTPSDMDGEAQCRPGWHRGDAHKTPCSTCMTWRTATRARSRQCLSSLRSLSFDPVRVDFCDHRLVSEYTVSGTRVGRRFECESFDMICVHT
jgi:hypothetical protein